MTMHALIDLSTSSLSSVQALGAKFGRSVTSVVLLNHPSPNELRLLEAAFPEAVFTPSFRLLTEDSCAGIDTVAMSEARTVAEFLSIVALGKIEHFTQIVEATVVASGSLVERIRKYAQIQRIKSRMRAAARLRNSYRQQRLEHWLLEVGSSESITLAGSLRRVEPFADFEPRPTLGRRNERAYIPMHEYRRGMSPLVLQDGFIPSNYPEYYYRTFLDGCTVVPRSPLSAAYFSGIGIPTQQFTWFHEKPMSTSAPKLSRRPRILVALNHTGYWTSEIDSADTDRVFAAAIALARNRPEIEVRVRLHPTASQLMHDGSRHHARLLLWVRESQLPNLSISNDSLEVDLSWAEFVLSEYSDVLIAAWRQAKPGASIRLGYRRHYMDEFSAIGFPEIVVDALDLLDLDAVVSACIVGRSNYNDLVLDWSS